MPAGSYSPPVDLPGRGQNSGDVVVGRFRLQALLGRGGSGDVWQAVDLQLGRTVALKRLIADDDTARRRLLREARALAAVRHENVVGVHDVIDGTNGGTNAGVDGSAAWLVLEHVDGRPLRALLDERLLEVSEVLALGRALVRALQVAHQAGVVHGDLKPDNVLLRGGVVDDASVVVVDFGLAAPRSDASTDAGIDAGTDERTSPAAIAATATISLRGTAAYLAPERVDVSDGRSEGRAVVDDGAADRYALGVVVYEALVGANPFRAATVAQTLARHVELVPAPPSSARRPGEIGAAVDDVVRGLLAKTPAARPGLTAVLEAFTALAPSAALTAGASTPAGSKSSRSSSLPPRPRDTAVIAGAIALALALVIGAVVVVVATGRQPPIHVPVVPVVPVVPAAVVVDAGVPVEHRAVEDSAVEDSTGVVDAGAGASVPVVVRRAPLPPVPVGMPQKLRWLDAHCKDVPCRPLLGPAPQALVDVQVWRASVDACVQRCRDR